MPGGNFDDELTIDGNNHVTPQGPLTLASGDTDIKVYAWVTQDMGKGAGAACSGEKSYSSMPTNKRWVASSSLDNYGDFVPGPALGTGMTISRSNGHYPVVHWWSETIILK